MKILTIPAMALALSFGATAAYADHHKDGKHERGPMTKAEYMKKAEERFNRMDKDSNGTVTKEERKAAMKKMWEKHGKDGKRKHHKRDHAKTNEMNEQFKTDMRDEPSYTSKGENNMDAKRVLKR